MSADGKPRDLLTECQVCATLKTYQGRKAVHVVERIGAGIRVTREDGTELHQGDSVQCGETITTTSHGMPVAYHGVTMSTRVE